MTSEILSIPEERLEEVIKVIITGLQAPGLYISKETRRNLSKWCNEEMKYLERLKDES